MKFDKVTLRCDDGAEAMVTHSTKGIYNYG